MRIEQIEISIFVPYTMEEKSPTLDVLITADEGLMEWKDNRLTLIGNVVLKRSDGSLILSNWERISPVSRVFGKIKLHEFFWWWFLQIWGVPQGL